MHLFYFEDNTCDNVIIFNLFMWRKWCTTLIICEKSYTISDVENIWRFSEFILNSLCNIKDFKFFFAMNIYEGEIDKLGVGLCKLRRSDSIFAPSPSHFRFRIFALRRHIFAFRFHNFPFLHLRLKGEGASSCNGTP